MTAPTGSDGGTAKPPLLGEVDSPLGEDGGVFGGSVNPSVKNQRFLTAPLRGPRKGEWPLWGEEKPRHRWNFPLAENVTLWLVLRRCGNPLRFPECFGDCHDRFENLSRNDSGISKQPVKSEFDLPLSLYQYTLFRKIFQDV